MFWQNTPEVEKKNVGNDGYRISGITVFTLTDTYTTKYTNGIGLTGNSP